MIIREAVIADLEAITDIYNWAVENTTATFDITRQSLVERRKWFDAHKGVYPLTVAEYEGKVVAYCSLSRFREKEAYAKSVEISVYVGPVFHGKGIGTALLEDIVKRGRTLGHHVIIAGITAGNDISIKMHEKAGFKLCGCFNQVGYKFNEWQDCLFYELLLD
ncbi:MAG: N-acetyltransferase family protein [Bacillota bacterium]|nr:N-acetyltransferase family protein [Bacillota bacterium]